MVFQWYLFVLIAVVAFLANFSGNVCEINTYGARGRRYTWLPVLLIIIPMIYLAATRGSMDGFGDTDAYRLSFHACPSSILGLSEYLTEDAKDKGFTVFTALIKSIIGDRDKIYFGIIATISLMCVAKTYKEYSCNFMMSIFLFIASAEFIQWNYNGIRQFIAVAVIFGAADLLLQKRYVPLIIIILIVSTIHASALLMLPVIFIVQGKPWNHRTLLFAVAVVIALLYLDRFTDLITTIMENSQYSNEVDQFLNTSGTNIMRVFVFAVPPVLSLIFRQYVAAANNPIINLSINMSIISLGVYIVSAFTSGIFIGRIPIFFSLYNYILIPWFVENVFEKKSQRVVYLIIILAYLAFYYYQVSVTWGL